MGYLCGSRLHQLQASLSGKKVVLFRTARLQLFQEQTVNGLKIPHPGNRDNRFQRFCIAALTIHNCFPVLNNEEKSSVLNNKYWASRITEPHPLPVPTAQKPHVYHDAGDVFLFTASYWNFPVHLKKDITLRKERQLSL